MAAWRSDRIHGGRQRNRQRGGEPNGDINGGPAIDKRRPAAWSDVAAATEVPAAAFSLSPAVKAQCQMTIFPEENFIVRLMTHFTIRTARGGRLKWQYSRKMTLWRRR